MLAYKSFVDFLVKYEEVNGKAMQAGSIGDAQGHQGPSLLSNDNTSLLKGHWGDELKEKLTKTVRFYSFHNLNSLKTSKTRLRG